MHEKRLLTPKEAAQRAGVSVSLIYRWTAEERRLAHYRPGGSGRRGKILIEEADLDAFLASLKVEAEQKVPGLSHISLPRPS